MRAELATLVGIRYGDRAVARATSISPSDPEIIDYERHNGLLSMWINLEQSPSLVIVDTTRLRLLRHAWVATRKPEALRLVMASDSQPVSEKVRRIGTFFGQKVEGLELSIYYDQQHRREVPYRDEVKPLW